MPSKGTPMTYGPYEQIAVNVDHDILTLTLEPAGEAQRLHRAR